jgi:two-component system CheB/CheR fusion protein
MTDLPPINVGAAVEPAPAVAGLTLIAGQALLEDDSFFRRLVDALPAAIYTTDPAGRITYFNEAAASLWGYRPELGKAEWCGSWKLFTPDGEALPHDQCPMAIAIKERRTIRGLEAVAERPDGSRVPFLPFPTPIYDADGVLLGAVNMLVEISDRKRDEEAAQRLAAIVEYSDDAIISTSLDSAVTSWNSGAERLYGYMADEMIGRSIKTLIPQEHQDEEDTILERVRRGERIEHYETVRQRKDGSLTHVSLSVSPIKDTYGRIVGASKIARDITQKKQQEAQIAILAREAEHRAKNVLATVQATVHLSQAATAEEMKQAISGRVQALASVHSLFVASRWAGADLQSLVAQELSPYSEKDGERIRIHGPEIVLSPQIAQTMAVALHELATNAAKYGALSLPNGRVEVDWTRLADGRLTLRWTEAGGPPVVAPARQGFGTRVLEQIFRTQLQGEMHFDWRSDGLHCRIAVAL